MQANAQKHITQNGTRVHFERVSQTHNTDKKQKCLLRQIF